MNLMTLIYKATIAVNFTSNKIYTVDNLAFEKYGTAINIGTAICIHVVMSFCLAILNTKCFFGLK